MSSKRIRVFFLMAVVCVPVATWARSAGPPIKRTGAAIDGGGECTGCHRTFAPANSGRGRVTIGAVPYTPGVKQTITVTIEDPDARRWGFELIARVRSNEARQAGTFTPNENTRVVCNPDERAAPCNGDLEFATHTLASTRPGTPSPGVYTVEWTPPSEDAGDISLYAAANAANNDGANAGDRIYTTSAVVHRACTLTGNPAVTGVTDAASFRPAISSNALISIFGGPFAPPDSSFRAGKTDLVNGKLPVEFACAALEIGGKRAPMFFVGANQVNAQSPILDVTGPVDVRVILNPGAANEIRSAAFRVQANVYSPAFFTSGQRIAALNASADNRVVTASAPAKPGDVVVLYGTGFGFSEPVYQHGEFPDGQAPLRDPFTITINGVAIAPADILYAGLSPDAPGLYQFNVRLPAGLPPGDLPVAIRMGSAETQRGAVLPVIR